MRSGYDYYLTYLAMKKHFTVRKFDFFKNNGVVKASYEAYEKRKEKYFFEQLAKKYDERQYHCRLLVAATLNPNFWIKDVLTENVNKLYFEWLGYHDAFLFSFKREVGKIRDYAILNNVETVDLFYANKSGRHPVIFKMLIRGDIKPETFLAIDSVLNFTRTMNMGDPLWVDKSAFLTKYLPFVNDVFPKNDVLLNVLKNSFDDISATLNTSDQPIAHSSTLGQ